MNFKKLLQGLTALIAITLIAGCGDDDNNSTTAIAADPNSVTYRVTFNATWSASSHPTNFPSNPHFSPLVGSVHNNGVTFWETGGAASAGIKAMAETGSTAALSAEVEAAFGTQTAGSLLSGGGVATSPGEVTLDFEVSPTFSRVTLVSMVAPSPDWFIGVSGLDLYDGGEWADEVTVNLRVYDAGTDSGTQFTSANDATSPVEAITALTTDAADADFTDGEAPVGTFTFTRIVE